MSEVFCVDLASVDERLSIFQKNFSQELPSRRVFKRGSQQGFDPRFLKLAIVGSRRSTGYGREVVHQLLERLRGEPVAIISGGAVGIDSASHDAAMKNGLPTRAWLVGPIERPGPRLNAGLFQRILQSSGGSLVVPDYLEPRRGQTSPPMGAASWLARNAWIAADSDILLVVEALEKSGTWQTLKMALDFGKPTFAVPGSLFNKSSQGCLKMISGGYAQGVESLDAFAESLIAHARRNFL
jgi:DNA processing protein